MKDFDIERREREQRDRTFRLAGQEFTIKPAVAPEAIARWGDMITETIDIDEATAIEIYDETILAFLEPGQEDKWAIVRDPNAAHPVSINDLGELVRWMFATATGRPTGEPSASGSGPESPETSSTDGSSSPAAVRAA